MPVTPACRAATRKTAGHGRRAARIAVRPNRYPPAAIRLAAATRRWLPGIAALGLSLTAAPAAACTLAGASTNLGSHSSYAVAAAPLTGSGSAGLACNVTLALLSAHYVAMQVDSSSFQLTGPGGSSLPFEASLSPGGPALVAGNFVNLSSISVLSLFSGTSNSIPVYIRTAPTAALRAGSYTGSLAIRWYYSVCSLGVALCLAHSSSPGFVRPLVGPVTNWGSGAPVQVNILLEVENDCLIQAPAINFGAAPLAGSFDPVTQTIQIRCSAGAAYTVGLDNGSHPSGATRRMQGGGHYLAYEIFKSATSPDRWGAVGAARRSSLAADLNPGIHDSVTLQGFTYRALIDPGQATPPAGAYSDTLRVDIEF
ncbi:Csu type fimbrial protein [Sphingopyxis solisilvae]|uniref:Csu type fimbrial protein n=1 Tax=Sphingopyxis solisilvae TaxID=1886788 RepID=UPI001892CCDD|nr:spore coat U domain-containing protein [Sphingopyxis solisilvae]